MEKRSRKSKRKFIITQCILIFFIILFLILYFYYKDINNRNIIKYNEKVKELSNAILNKENELKELTDYYNSNSNIDDKINNLKDEYFNYLKELELDVKNGKKNIKIAYLTIDDGPYYNTYKVLDILDQHNVKATFFTTTVNGTYCYDNRKYECFNLYKEYIKRGHTIANHTYTHAIRYGLYNSVNSFIDAVKKQEEQVKKYASNYKTNILRFPGGSSTAGSLKNNIVKELQKLGYGYVDWNGYDGDGWNLSSKEEAWKYFTSSINEKIEVILLHDYSRYTTQLLPDMIKYLEDNNYILLPLFYDSIMIKK